MEFENLYDIESNIFVFASAGAGKTTALVNRFIKLIIAGNNPNSIYCITYTNVAANEMKERIFKKIKILMSFNYTELSNELKIINYTLKKNYFEDLKNLLNKININNLNIMTIDSLAYKILFSKKKFEILTTEKKNELIDEVLVEFFYSSENENNNIFIKRILDKNDKFLIKNIIKFTLDNIEYFYNLYLKDNLKIKILNPLISSINNNKINDLYLEIKNYLLSNLDYIKENIQEKYSLIFDNIFTIDETSINQIISNSSTKNNKIYAHLLKSKNEKIKSLFHLIQELVSAKNELNYRNLFEEICKIIQKIMNIIDNKNIFKNYLTFEQIKNYITENIDIENHFLIDQKISHILIDEAQDCVNSSWNLIKKISNSFFYGIGYQNEIRTIFAVGDEKQTIFSFQGGNNKLFIENALFFKDKSINFNIKFQIINLNKSYRFSEKILNIISKYLNNEINNSFYIGVIDNEKKENTNNKAMWKINKIEYKNNILNTNFLKHFDKNLFIIGRTNNTINNFYDNLNFDTKKNITLTTTYFKNNPVFIKIIFILLKINHKKHNIYYLLKNIYHHNVIKCEDEIFDQILKNYNKDYKNLNSFIIFVEKNNLKNNLKNFNSNIKVSTVHGIKGLEANEIILINENIDINIVNNKLFIFEDKLFIVNNELLLIKNEIENYKNLLSEEEKRIFYVAITRAKKEIYIIKNKENKKKSWSSYLL